MTPETTSLSTASADFRRLLARMDEADAQYEAERIAAQDPAGHDTPWFSLRHARRLTTEELLVNKLAFIDEMEHDAKFSVEEDDNASD